MKVFIYGNGYLAKKFSDFFNAEISSRRVSDVESIKQELDEKKPDVVINCAGKTGRPNVDWCEDHKVETIAGNITTPLLLAQACVETGVYCVHLSSGCIYEGNNHGLGFSEIDAPNYEGSFYSKTKLWSEKMLAELPTLILRLRMPVDGVPDERNFITKIVKYKQVINIDNSITVIDDLLAVTKTLIEKHATGIYNVTNPGVIGHKEILDMYRAIVDPYHSCEFISLDALYAMTKAKRSNCVLNTDKLVREGIYMRPVTEAVRDCLGRYKEHVLR